MSVWKRMESKVLEENVDRKILEMALKDFNVTLDYNTNKIDNYYGKDSVDAAFRVNGKLVSLGINFNKNKGIVLVGDTYGTGLGRDNGQQELMDKIAQSYQKHNIKNVLDQNGWTIDTENIVDGKIEIEVYQF